MPNSSLTIQVPGKLMVAGEFAVLEPYQKLITMAVNRFVYVSIEESDEHRLTLESFELRNMDWHYRKNQVMINSTDKRVNFVQAALTIACNYLSEKHIPIQPMSITVRSELDDRTTGKKFGLGSSAAVVVGVIRAVLQWHVEKVSSELVFKLAAISHVAAQGNGSGADVAASSFGGIIEYSSFQADWLREKYYSADSLLDLIQMEWKYLAINPTELPPNVYVCIGWTGSPASTGNLVNQILQLKEDNAQQYQHFLHESKHAVEKILEGIHQHNLKLLFDGIKQNRTALVKVGKDAKTELETPIITKLCDLAEAYGGAAKQSGAGGGDCGIAFMPTKESAKELLAAWQEEGIIPLDISLYPDGAKVI